MQVCLLVFACTCVCERERVCVCVICVCVCVWKHLGTRCWLFRTRLDETNDDRRLSIHYHLHLSGFDVSWIRESFRFQNYNFSRGVFRCTTTCIFQVPMSPEFEDFSVFNTTISAGGQWISFHPLPNEDGGLRLWYLWGTPWRRTCKFELFELLTSCCNTVFPSKFRLQSDRFPTNVRHMSVWFPSNFRSFSVGFPSNFWPISMHFPISFELHFDELGQLGLRLLPDDRLFRTNFNVCVNRGLWDNLSLPRTTPDKHVELSSVCVSPPGATSSRLDGPSEKVPVRKPQLMFPNEPGRPSCHGLKAVQPALWAITASRAPEFKHSRAIQALGGFQPLIRPR